MKNLARLKVFLFFVLMFLGQASIAFAQKGEPGQPLSRPLVLLLVLASLGMVPFIAVMVTSFVKIVVVLSLIRTALGTQQIPPNQVITGLAFVLTIYVMMPVGLQIKSQVGDLIQKQVGKELVSNASMDLLLKGIEKGREPLRDFLLRNAGLKERDMFYDIAKRMRTPEQREELTPKDFSVVVPSFVITELKEAFQIGFLIFLPFLVIDMVVANILLALGMFQLSPITVSLPFKLLLFVLVDGWFLITQGLMLGYVP